MKIYRGKRVPNDHLRKIANERPTKQLENVVNHLEHLTLIIGEFKKLNMQVRQYVDLRENFKKDILEINPVF
jgi:hypothetical protein